MRNQSSQDWEDTGGHKTDRTVASVMELFMTLFRQNSLKVATAEELCNLLGG